MLNSDRSTSNHGTSNHGTSNHELPGNSVLAIHMGDSFTKLSPLLQKSHLGRSQLSGLVNVKQGNTVARLICRAFNLPNPGHDIDLTVNCEHHSESMSWKRNFNGQFMNSSFRRQGDHLIETLGPIALILKATEHSGALKYQFEKTKCFGVPVPKFLSPRIAAVEREEGGYYRFSVVVSMFLIGPVISYGGMLTVQSV